jgi:tRNA G10  N-methylase Trm11
MVDSSVARAIEPKNTKICDCFIVLDPFAGSGSALVAARQLGRQCVGIEIDEQHYHTATTRIQEAQGLAA